MQCVQVFVSELLLYKQLYITTSAIIYTTQNYSQNYWQSHCAIVENLSPPFVLGIQQHRGII